MYRFVWLLVALGMVGAFEAAQGQDGLGPNLLANGDFEAGGQDWWHPKDRYGGQLDTELRHGGLNSWRMELDEPEHEVYASRSGRIERGRDHHLSVWIRCREVAPANAISIRALQFAAGKPAGWYERDGRVELVQTGGSHGWHRFAISIPAARLKAETESLAIFVRAAAGSEGTVWFDDVALRVITGEAPAELVDAQAAPPLDLNELQEGQDDAAAFRDIPFLDKVGEGVEIDCGSDHNLIYGPEPARVTIQVAPREGARLNWIISDYHGRKVDAGSGAGTTTIEVARLGYFEVAARLTRDGEQIGAARTSFAHVAEHPFEHTSPQHPFGSWVQQSDLLDDIGARWTRLGTGWKWLEPQRGKPNQRLWESLDAHVNGMAQSGIQPIFLFAKVPSWAGPHYKRVAPEHWDDFRSFVRKCVEGYRDQVDVWEVMNEPYIPTLFPGTLEEVMQWHRIVREEVDRGDAGGKVIGPCLNTRRDYLLAEMRDLLELGIGDLVDGIAIHTYGGLEATGFVQDIAKLRSLLREYDADKALYITEQGLSVPEELPMERLQAQHLARMILLSMQADVKAVIWHMMSWPQGGSAEQRDFAIVRARKDLQQRAPRPAFVAAGTVARVLGKARFVKAVEGLGTKIGAQVYERQGKPILALWNWGSPREQVEVSVGASEVIVVDLMGAREARRAPQGRLRIALTPDPVFVLGGSAAVLLGEE